MQKSPLIDLITDENRLRDIAFGRLSHMEIYL